MIATTVSLDFDAPDLDAGQWTWVAVAAWYVLAWAVMRPMPQRWFDVMDHLKNPNKEDVSPRTFKMGAWVVSPILGVFWGAVVGFWAVRRVLFGPYQRPACNRNTGCMRPWDHDGSCYIPGTNEFKS